MASFPKSMNKYPKKSKQIISKINSMLKKDSMWQYVRETFLNTFFVKMFREVRLGMQKIIRYVN